MTDRILLYISAAPDLALERETLGRAVTEIPTSLGWRVGQTPLDDAEPDLDLVAAAQVHLLLLGEDVRAPVGLEWATARRAGRLPVLLLKQAAPRTQAGAAFQRELARHADWKPFKDAADLRRQALRLLVNHILASSIEYLILPEEIERLAAWEKEALKPGRKSDQPERGGAGEGGVILSTERFTPSQGKLIKGT
jgi:hypothetical protein